MSTQVHPTSAMAGSDRHMRSHGAARLRAAHRPSSDLVVVAAVSLIGLAVSLLLALTSPPEILQAMLIALAS